MSGSARTTLHERRQASVRARAASDPVEAGAYLVRITGCNDCHTAGYLENQRRVPRDEWLQGWSVGLRGPRGTTYRRNLTLTVQRMSEDAWVEMLGSTETNPPMPWFNLHDRSGRDRRETNHGRGRSVPEGEAASRRHAKNGPGQTRTSDLGRIGRR